MFFTRRLSTNIVIGHLHWLCCNFTTRAEAGRQQSVPRLCFWEGKMVPEGFTEEDLLCSVDFVPPPHLFSLAWQKKPVGELWILSHFLIYLPLFLKFAFLQPYWCSLEDVFIMFSKDVLQLLLLHLFILWAISTLGAVFLFLFLLIDF